MLPPAKGANFETISQPSFRNRFSITNPSFPKFITALTYLLRVKYPIHSYTTNYTHQNNLGNVIGRWFSKLNYPGNIIIIRFSCNHKKLYHFKMEQGKKLYLKINQLKALLATHLLSMLEIRLSTLPCLKYSWLVQNSSSLQYCCFKKFCFMWTTTVTHYLEHKRSSVRYCIS